MASIDETVYSGNSVRNSNNLYFFPLYSNKFLYRQPIVAILSPIPCSIGSAIPRDTKSTLPCSFLVNGGRFLMSWHGVQCIKGHVHARSSKVLASIDKPLDNGDYDDNRERSNGIV